MLRSIILVKLAREEKKLGASLDYVRFILEASLKAFFRFVKIIPWTQYRKTLPVDVFSIAKILACQHADCGSCLQIEIDLALANGVSRDVLQKVLDGSFEELSEEFHELCRFTRAIVTASGEEIELREKIVGRYGKEGLVELAFAIAGSRVFPEVKRTLGFAVSCEKVKLTLE